MAAESVYRVDEEKIRRLLELPAYGRMMDRGCAWVRSIGDEVCTEADLREITRNFIVNKCKEYCRLDQNGCLADEQQLLKRLEMEIDRGTLFPDTSVPALSSLRVSAKMLKVLLLPLACVALICLIGLLVAALYE